MQWQHKKSCMRRELLSLIGQLQHTCKVVHPGRTFLRCMIDLSTWAKEMHHYLCLNAAFSNAAMFLGDWNWVSMIIRHPWLSYQAIITSDASGSWGCGAFNSSLEAELLQLKWPESWSSIHITSKELIPIIIATAVWGRKWQGNVVQCMCDNVAVVALVMHLLRCLFFFQAVFSLSLHAVHLPGKINIAADCLSRDNLPSFFQQVSKAGTHPTLLPEEHLNALIHYHPDWTSKNWTVWFNNFNKGLAQRTYKSTQDRFCFLSSK